MRRGLVQKQARSSAHGQCEAGGKRHIGSGSTSESRHPDSCRQHPRHRSPSRGAENPPRQQRDAQYGAERKHTGRPARSHFRAGKQSKSDVCRPVVKRRLLQPRRAIQPRRHPIASAGHGAGNRGIARLVGAHEAEAIEACKKAMKYDEGKNQRAERDAKFSWNLQDDASLSKVRERARTRK